MRQRTKTTVAIVTGIVFALGGLVFWMRDNDVAKALELQAHLTSDDPQLAKLHKGYSQTLTRMVDKMDRDELRALNEQVRERRRAMFDENLTEYLDASETARTEILDQHIADLQKWNTVYEALRTDAFRMRGGRNRNRQTRQARSDQAGRGARQDRGNAARDGGSADRRDDRRPRTPEAEERSREVSAYWIALSDRAEELGVQLRPSRRRGAPRRDRQSG